MATRKMIELSFAVEPKPGELSRVLHGLNAEGVNVLAFCGFNDGARSARIMIVPDNDAKARKAAERMGLETKVTPVVAVTGEAGRGAGAKLAKRLLDAGIDIEHTYASTPGSGQSTAIFKVPDPDAALAALKKR